MITNYHFHMHTHIQIENKITPNINSICTHTSQVKIKLRQIHYKILKIYHKYDNQS